MERAQAERAEREPRRAAPRESDARARTGPRLRRRPQRRQQADRARRAGAAARSAARRPRTGRATAGRRARRAPGLARRARAARRAGRARSRAGPEAARPARRAAARPRARAGAAAERGRRPRRRPARADRRARRRRARPRPRRSAADRTRPKRSLGLLDTRLPEDRLADPGLAGEDERRRALLDRGQERLDRAELLLAPDHVVRHAPRIVADQEPSAKDRATEGASSADGEYQLALCAALFRPARARVRPARAGTSASTWTRSSPVATSPATLRSPAVWLDEDAGDVYATPASSSSSSTPRRTARR